ncbi:MAG TPA: hypothetical protein VFA38_11670, partial [Nitrospirales bacterium]|nr:hypothetical protein [Nitrospirales bacterium]
APDKDAASAAAARRADETLRRLRKQLKDAAKGTEQPAESPTDEAQATAPPVGTSGMNERPTSTGFSSSVVTTPAPTATPERRALEETHTRRRPADTNRPAGPLIGVGIVLLAAVTWIVARAMSRRRAAG